MEEKERKKKKLLASLSPTVAHGNLQKWRGNEENSARRFGGGAQYFRVGHIPSRMDHKTRDLSAKRKAPRCEVYRYIYSLSLSLFSTLAVNSTTWHVGIGELREKRVGWQPPPYLILSLLFFPFILFLSIRGWRFSCFGYFFLFLSLFPSDIPLFDNCYISLSWGARGACFISLLLPAVQGVYLHFI